MIERFLVKNAHEMLEDLKTLVTQLQEELEVWVSWSFEKNSRL